jgi:hypothetical protein
MLTFAVLLKTTTPMIPPMNMRLVRLLNLSFLKSTDDEDKNSPEELHKRIRKLKRIIFVQTLYVLASLAIMLYNARH